MKNNFNLLASFSDKDFFPDYEGEIFTNVIRKCVRIIIFDNENNVCLVKAKTFLIPGGGVEENESLIDTAKREAMEETGSEIKDIKPLGKTIESRAKKGGVQETFCFTAILFGEKKKPTTTQEDEIGMEVFWHPIEVAIEKLKEQQPKIHPESYNTHFNLATHILFLEELINKLK